MVVRVKNCEPMDEIMCTLQALQVLPHNTLRIHKMNERFALKAQTETTFAFHLYGSRALELCFGQTFDSLNDTRLKLRVKFHGLQPSLHSFTMFSSQMIARIDIQSNFNVEAVKPGVTLNRFVQPLMYSNNRPIEHKVRPLDSRDVIPPAQQLYEAKGQVLRVGSNSLLYDLSFGPEYISLVWMIFNSDTKQFIGAGVDLPSSVTILD
ncbi:unnamed protein product [Oppiella nova]|uniref:Uncharacterized protein n=1 Tax=Oppiella nova TaxID=334625 RepID=A0A7R9QIM9_9ACAR|nr:unnamed protein product [Oppiella nova]CAG2166111.1 unnamed protein product [Oppiella nova]